MLIMYKLKNNKGRISLLELLIIIFIVVEVIFLGYKGLHWYYVELTGGHDGLAANTAYSTAIANSLNGHQCPVSKCGGTNCIHYKNDEYVGYYDAVSHLIVGEPTEGYNQSRVMRIDSKLYFGDPGTMVIEIRCHDDDVSIAWVKVK